MEHGLQQNLELLEQYWQNYALTVVLNKSGIMIFQEKPRSQETKYQFKLGKTHLDHTLKISSSCSFVLAVNALKQNACQVSYAVRIKWYQIGITFRICTKVFDSIIQPHAFYATEL